MKNKYPSIMDLHTHTVASGHAYNSIREMAKAASEKGLEVLGNGRHADPADHRHGELERRKNARHAADLATLHVGLVEPVGKGHGKGIHGKADAQENAVKKEGKAQIHRLLLRIENAKGGHPPLGAFCCSHSGENCITVLFLCQFC